MLLKKNAELIDAEEKPELLKLLPPFEGKSVLDLGAGIGRFTAEFAQKAKDVVAVDLCPHFIEENKKANSACQNIEWICSDALDIDFKPQQFDLIFIYGVLMYLPETELQILENKFQQWLKPKGVLFFVETCAPVTHFSATEMYYAHYRSSIDYDRFFKKWTLLNQGNIQAYEDLLADPLKCFWIYTRSTIKFNIDPFI
jgi:phosphoethanolamine N-methyltransferase